MDTVISSSCRTCMKNNVDNLFHLYESVKIDESNIQLVELLMECTTIQVTQDDGLPQNICTDCRNAVHMWFSFKQQALKSNNEFIKQIEDFKNINIKTEFDDHCYEPLPEPEISQSFKLEDQVYNCDQCHKTYTVEKKFLKHQQSHTANFTCNFCDKKYHKESSFLKHECKQINFEESPINLYSEIEIKKENGDVEKKYKCSLCENMYTKARSVKIHIKKHQNANCFFICDTCGKKFSRKPLLKRHIKLHYAGENGYDCNKCGKSYTRSDQLKNHMLTHREHKPNVCPHCNKAFSQLCSLKDHIRTHTKETPFLCSECGKGFANRSNLRQHMLRHTGIKQFECKMCPKVFCTKGQMVSHMVTHSGEQPYKCETCGAAFTKHNSLKKHANIHTGQKPYACDSCSMRACCIDFTKHNSLKKHANISGKKPYACDSCSMRFTCKDHLTRHYRIHTGEKPYKCTYCQRAFTQSNDLVKHLRSHVGHNIYTCTVCGAGFRLKAELKQHYPIHYCPDKPKPIPTVPLDNRNVKTELSNIQPDKFMITINSLDGSNLVAINIEPSKTLDNY